MSPVKKAIVMDVKDNVATMLSQVEKGMVVAVVSTSGEVVRRVSVKECIPFAHKLALRRIEKGGEVTKYGENMGIASKDIEEGEWVHVHNVESTIVPGRSRS